MSRRPPRSKRRRRVPGWREPAGRRRDRHRRDNRPASEHRRGDGHQPRLEFLVGHRVAALPRGCQFGRQRRVAGDGARRAGFQPAARQLRRSEREQYLAQRGAMQRDRQPDPVRAADQVPAVHLGDLLDQTAVARHAEVDGLAGLLAEPGEHRLGEAHKIGLESAAAGVGHEDLAGGEPAGRIAADQAVALQRGQQPGGRALGQPADRGQLRERDRVAVPRHLDQQLRRAVDGLRTRRASLFHITKHCFTM